MLADDGLATFEFPHLVAAARANAVRHDLPRAFQLPFAARARGRSSLRHGLAVVDVDRIPTHGGSLRLWVAHAESRHSPTQAVDELRRLELARGLAELEHVSRVRARVRKIKNDLLRFLIDAAERGKRVAAYGAAAKGNTLLNYCGVRSDSCRVRRRPEPAQAGPSAARQPTADRSGSNGLNERRPDYVLILP